ncbi:CG14106 [Drosophila busckii]|uniref:CG14106 n=2 Tax=Drosophila busckii TaxID=30019 RepID=A0A0M4F9X6_DROBS|nr:CG14106 [Drosophila busckii]
MLPKQSFPPGPSPTQRNFLRENKLLARQTPVLMLRRPERRWPNYELPTAASLARQSVAPPLNVTQRRLVNGGRNERATWQSSQRSLLRSEKEIQTEDINDEQFLNAALLKCAEAHEQQQQQTRLPRACSEGDELPAPLNAGHSITHCLRRTASNFELGKMPVQRASYQSMLRALAVSDNLPSDLDYAASYAKAQQTADNASIGSEACAPAVLQLAMPNVTDVEQELQIDHSLSSSSSSKHQLTAAAAAAEESPVEPQLEVILPPPQPQLPQQVLLEEPQRALLVAAAQQRYRQLIWEYNHLPIAVSTLRVRNLKIQLEQELDMVDNELTVLNLPQVYIHREHLPQLSAQLA